MESAAPSTFKTFETNAYEETIHGKVFVGKVVITINEGQIDLNRYSNRLSLEELTEVKNAPSFEAFDFPLFDFTDTHMSEAEQEILQPVVQEEEEAQTEQHEAVAQQDESKAHYEEFFQTVTMDDDDEGVHLEEFDQMEHEHANDYETEFVPINHPFQAAGVKVNGRGEVLLDVDEDTLKTSRLRFLDTTTTIKPIHNIDKISKENKGKKGPVVSFEIYRNHAWLKAGDFHLPTEMIKTFRPQFQLHEIEVIHFDGDSGNCHIDNLVAKVKIDQPLETPVLTPLPTTGNWTYNKFWNGQIVPNSISSFDGNIASIDKSGHLQMKNISPKTAGYYININGVRFDARKLVWRAFTDTEPAYSSEHYKIHIIDDARDEKFSFDNLHVAVVSSIFNQWSKEDEEWPWTRAKKGVLPKPERKPKKEKKQRVF